MADGRRLPHIGGIERFSSPLTYKGKPGRGRDAVPRNRAQHGARIRQQLEAVREQFHLSKDVELPPELVRDDAVYVEIYSAWGTELKFDQLHSDKGIYELLTIDREVNPSLEGQYRTRAVVMLTEGGISHFLKRVNLYLNENTKKKGVLTDKPKANDLIANIEEIQRATLKAFWKDGPEFPFPQPEEVVWWEVWFRRTTDSQGIQRAIDNLTAIGAQIGVSELKFPEHIVRLVKGSANQLSQSLLLLDSLSELRKPQETADFVLRTDDAQEWSADLLSRIDNMSTPDSVLICLLDSGVNHLHPLLLDFLPESNLYTWNEAWGKDDGVRYGGHGTGMAGLTLYGDMVDTLASSGRIQIYHALESFKLISSYSSNSDPELYGQMYERGCSEPIIDRPNNPRVFCLSVTNEHFAFNGRPSVHSAALDKIAFGNAEESREPQLILVSGGNVELASASDFPDKNFLESVKDPAQAFNVLTVGAYTRKDKIDADVWSGWQPLAASGEMAPSNSTSGAWETRWPNKPDIVMEGGNLAHKDGEVDNKDSLQLLTTHKNHHTKLFQPFGDTSAAVALASKLAAELRTEYPTYWPETIRGLMVHSAEWTEAMLRGRDMRYEADRRAVLRSVGYGVPIAEKARHSGSNMLTLVAEREIQPFIANGGSPKFNEYHLYELPWPKEVLENELADKEVTLKVTLSYFIEPNPGERRYASQFRYQSHELDFRIITATESLRAFKSRISEIAQTDEESSEEEDDSVRSTENWKLGRVRSRGSVRKDFIKTLGANLASQNKLAIYPKGGWYKTRKKLARFDSSVRYSLIISIETEEAGVDIYTPVAIKLGVAIAV
jgi:hypothetical protein